MARYLDNADLEAAIKAKDRDAVAGYLMTLAEHVVASRAATFPPTLEASDVVQVAVMDALRRLDRWEPGRASAFSYCTSSVLFTVMSEAKKERTWAERHPALLDGLDGETA